MSSNCILDSQLIKIYNIRNYIFKIIFFNSLDCFKCIAKVFEPYLNFENPRKL